jgi:hypothetical protein
MSKGSPLPIMVDVVIALWSIVGRWGMAVSSTLTTSRNGAVSATVSGR